MQLSFIEAEFLMELMQNYCLTICPQSEKYSWSSEYDEEGLDHSQIDDLWNRIQDEKFNK